MIWLLVTIIVVCAAAFWLWRRREKTGPAAPASHTARALPTARAMRASPTTQAAHADDSRKFHCVTILVSSDSMCEAAQRLEGKRFLSTEAPFLPLHDCTAGACRCRYVHYDDRREDERRNPFGRYNSIPPAFINKDRRNISGRRAMDSVDLDENRI